MIDEAALTEILEPGTLPRLVEPDIFSLYPPGQGANSYDGKGALAFYDLVACNPVYNFLAWGYRTSTLAALCRQTLQAATTGWVLDTGCGSLAFTAEVYASYSDRPVILLDQSLTLLRKARERLFRLSGSVPTNIALVHGDALHTGFRSGVFGAIVAMNLLHVLPDLEGLAAELGRVRAPGAPLLCTTLVRAGRLADRYLDMWAQKGELVARRPEQVVGALTRAGMAATCTLSGSMAFVRAQ